MSEQQANSKKKKWNTRGFYIALSVCLVAVGVAAWTTYDSITGNLNSATDVSQSTVDSKDTPTGQAVSGVLEQSSVDNQLESKASAILPSSSPAEQTKSTVSQVTRKPEQTSSMASQTSKPASTTINPTVFSYPLAKDITKAYSGDNLVFSQTMQDWRVHQGTDLRAKAGDAVAAIAEGTVKDIYDDPMLGNVIVISHGSVEAYYCGLGDTALVKKDASVKAGQKIGSVGVVPMELTEEPHLHLELKKDGKWVDPAEILTESAKKVS